jgi:hypothetical protein
VRQDLALHGLVHPPLVLFSKHNFAYLACVRHNPPVNIPRRASIGSQYPHVNAKGITNECGQTKSSLQYAKVFIRKTSSRKLSSVYIPYARIVQICRFLQNLGNQTANILVIATEKNPPISEIRP